MRSTTKEKYNAVHNKGKNDIDRRGTDTAMTKTLYTKCSYTQQLGISTQEEEKGVGAQYRALQLLKSALEKRAPRTPGLEKK